MLWLYSRQSEALELMTHYDNRNNQYVLTLYWADGRNQEERFTSATDFRKRLLEVESLLASDRWAIDGPPKFFAEGWPEKPRG
jgi:hypothetical protein